MKGSGIIKYDNKCNNNNGTKHVDNVLWNRNTMNATNFHFLIEVRGGCWEFDGEFEWCKREWECIWK